MANEFQTTLEFSKQLYRFVRFDLGPNRAGRFLLIIHHAVFDGYSMLLMLQDLHDKVHALGKGEIPPAPAESTSVREWAAFLQRYSDSPEGIRESAYWTSLRWQDTRDLMDYPQGFLSNKSGKEAFRGTETEVSQYVGLEHSQFLLERGRLGSFSISDIVLTAMAHAIARVNGSKVVSFDLISNGRAPVFRGIDLSRTMGWLADNVPVLIELEDYSGVENKLAEFVKQFNAIPNSGVGFNALKYLSSDEKIRERMHAIPVPEILVNYIPDVSGAMSPHDKELKERPEQLQFRVAKESHGQTEPPADKGLHRASCATISVVKGRLSIVWNFRDNVYQKDTVALAASYWKEEMEQIIAHFQPRPSVAAQARRIGRYLSSSLRKNG